MWNMREWMHGKTRRACIIGALLWCDVSWLWTGGMWVCWHGCVATVQFPWSYKAEGHWSGLAQQLACLLPFELLQYSAMSLINNRTFERSMGHQISREDAQFHLHTSDGQHYLSNQQVRSCTDLGLTNLTRVLVVGGPCDDAWQLVSSLGCRSNTQWPALASSTSNGSCAGVTSWFQAGSQWCDDVDVVASGRHQC